MTIDDFITIIKPGPKRAKFSNQNYIVQIGELEVQEKEKNQAISEIMIQARSALTGSYNPAVVFYHGFIGVTWRHPIQGYLYRILDPNEQHESKTVKIHSCSSGEYTTDWIVRLMRRHMADYVWDQDRTKTQQIATELIENEEDREQFIRMCRWQERYTELKATGLEDNEIRNQLMKERL